MIKNRSPLSRIKLVCILLISVGIFLLAMKDQIWESKEPIVFTMAADADNPSDARVFTFSPEYQHQLKLTGHRGNLDPKPLDDIRLFSVGIKYPSGEPDRDFSPKEDSILIHVNMQDRNRATHIFKEFPSDIQQRLLATQSRGQFIEFDPMPKIIYRRIRAAMIDDKGYPVVIIQSPEGLHNYDSDHPLNNEINIRYMYSKNLPVSFKDMDDFVMNFIRSHSQPISTSSPSHSSSK